MLVVQLEKVFEDCGNTQRADSRGVRTIQTSKQIQTITTEIKIKDFGSGPSWCLRFMRQNNLTIRSRMTLCQQPPPDYE